MKGNGEVRMINSNDTSLIAFVRDVKKKGSKGHFLERMEYSMEEYQRVSNLEANLLDAMTMIFREQNREARLADQDVVLDGTIMFLDALLTDNGVKYLSLLDEHISTHHMKMFFLTKLYEKFESEVIFPLIDRGFEEGGHDFRD
jgi:hypothetical protein